MLCPNRGDKTTYSYFIPTISRGEKEEARSFSLLFIYIECMYFFLKAGDWMMGTVCCELLTKPVRVSSLYNSSHNTVLLLPLFFLLVYSWDDRHMDCDRCA